MSATAAALRHVLTFARSGRARGARAHLRRRAPGALDDATAAVGEDDLFTFIYTSGTTGPPKACMIPHRNYYEMARVVDRCPASVAGRRPDAPLPPARPQLRATDAPLGADVGFTIALLSRPAARRRGACRRSGRRSSRACRGCSRRCTRPSVARFDEATGPDAGSSTGRSRVGREVSALAPGRRAAPGALAAPARGSPTGSSSRRLRSASAAGCGSRSRAARRSRRRSREFFHAFDVLILEGYGLTECTTACIVNRPRPLPLRHRRPAAAGLRGPIADDGEILVRSGTVFAGYHKDEEATREVLDDDGWLHTGDIGEIDADGFLTITDRKKDILVTAGGKNVAPQNLENELKASKYVSQALVLGDRRPYVAALITLDEAEVAKWRGAGGADVQARPGRRRRGQRRALALRADQAVRDPATRLLRRRGRGHADAEATPPRRRRSTSRTRSRQLYSG